MADNRDFGHFGKDSTGYAHYMQTFNETNKGGGRPPKRNNSGCAGLGWAVALILGSTLLYIIAAIFNIDL